jgi:membrane-associated phospholipid phosphatase
VFPAAPDELVDMQRPSFRIFASALGICIWLITCGTALCDGISTAGDVLQIVLPTTAGGLTLGLRDWQGSVQLAESSALTLGVTYGLKYSVHETRPNGGSQSFPSGHSSISFSAAEFLQNGMGGSLGYRLTLQRHSSHKAVWSQERIIHMKSWPALPSEL